MQTTRWALLVAQVCHTLLPTLVHRKPLCRRLVNLPSWQALAADFARRDVNLTRHLSQKFQRALSRCLCLAASGFSDTASPQQYVSGLMAQTVNEAMELPRQSQQQLTAAAQQADVQLQVRVRIRMSTTVLFLTCTESCAGWVASATAHVPLHQLPVPHTVDDRFVTASSCITSVTAAAQAQYMQA